MQKNRKSSSRRSKPGCTHSHWLLILDNADNLDLLPSFLPPAPGGHILLTTRAWAMRGLAARLEVETLDDEQGALLLLRRAGRLDPGKKLAQASSDERQWATRLVHESGGLPLALDQAGAYLEATGISLEEYYQTYQPYRPTLQGRRERTALAHPDAVVTTLSLSLQRIEEKNTAAAELLRCCAYLASDAIPEEIFTQGAKHLGLLLKPVAADAHSFARAVEALRIYSLVGRDTHTRMLTLHRLVQAVVRDDMSAKAARQWKKRVVLAVHAAHPDVTDIKQWDACERWLPHALVCAVWIEQEQITSPAAASLLNAAGYYLVTRARYREAEPLYQRVLAIREQQLGTEHPQTARSLNNLALLYYYQGKYEQAEPLYQRALAIREQVGPEHSTTARSLNNLALLYYYQGEYEQAEPLYQRALAIWEQQLGPEHPDTQTVRRNYAALQQKIVHGAKT